MAVQYASSRSAAGYLANLKPILDHATTTRSTWLRSLSTWAQADEMADQSEAAMQLAIRCREQFNEARRALKQMAAPEMYRDMERALDGWLDALATSCEPIATAHPPVTVDQINAARRKLKDAAQQADKFNAERSSIITVGAPAAEAERDPSENLGNNKRLIVLTLLGLVLMIVALYFAFGALGTSRPLTLTPGPGTPGAGTLERRIFQRTEVLDRLKQEIVGRQVAWLEPDVKLVPPDRIFITGKIQGPTGLVPVEAELQIGVTDTGRPRITPLKINATGVALPQGALDALTKRTDEANKVLPDQIAPNQVVRRIYVEGDTIVAELASAAPPAGTPGAKPATKPGG